MEEHNLSNIYEASLKVPLTTSGIRSLLKSLHHPTRTNDILENEPEWEASDLSVQYSEYRTTLEDLQYENHEINIYNGVRDNLAVYGPFRFLSNVGIEKLYFVCEQLKAFAECNSYVISNRTRGSQRHSKFIYDMIRDKNLLLALSRVVGVPLIPHPLKDAAVQVNYYNSLKLTDDIEKKEIGKWHCDGMDYVFTVLLDDKSTFEGGEYVYYHGHKDAFLQDPNRSERVKNAGFTKKGQAMFTHGSQVYHCVTPLTQGKRTALVISLFCPYFAKYDSNRFLHSAPDDGILRALKDWFEFKIPVWKPEYYFKYVNAPLITWDML